MKTFIMFIGLLGLMTFTNPSISEHKETVGKVMVEIITEESSLLAASNTDATTVDIAEWGIKLVMNEVKPLIEDALEDEITVEDFYIFSLTKGNLDGNGDKFLGIGVFGRVIVPDAVKEELRKALKENFM
jgi:hypothetical protein